MAAHKEWLKAYGDHKIAPLAEHNFMLTKSLVLDKEDTYQRLCSKFELRRQISEKLARNSTQVELAKIATVRSHETRGFCSNMYKIEISFELSGHSLEAELTQRKKVRSHFSESALHQIYKDSMNSLKMLAECKLSHNNLRPSYLLITPSCRTVLLDNLNELDKDDIWAAQKVNLLQSLSLYVSSAVFDKICTVHPSQRAPSRESCVFESNHSCDLFALGLILLEAGLLKEVPRMVCNSLVFRHQGSLDWKVLDELIEEFGEKFTHLKKPVSELLSRAGPARTDPNYLMKCRIEEQWGKVHKNQLDESWEGKGISSQEALDLFKTDQQDGGFLNNMKGLIFNSNQQLETPKDSFLEDSLIVAHHITPVTQNPGLQMQEDKLVFTPTKPAQNSPIFRFVDENTGYQPAPNTVLSSLIREPTTPTRGTTPPVQHYTPTRQERITFNPHPPSSPVMSQPSVQQTQPKPSPLRNQVPDVRAIQYQGNQTQNNHTGNLQPNEYSPVTAKRMRKRFIQKVDTQVSQMMLVGDKENISFNTPTKLTDHHILHSDKREKQALNPLEFRFSNQSSQQLSPLRQHREYSVNYQTPIKASKSETGRHNSSFNPFSLY